MARSNVLVVRENGFLELGSLTVDGLTAALTRRGLDAAARQIVSTRQLLMEAEEVGQSMDQTFERSHSPLKDDADRYNMRDQDD